MALKNLLLCLSLPLISKTRLGPSPQMLLFFFVLLRCPDKKSHAHRASGDLVNDRQPRVRLPAAPRLCLRQSVEQAADPDRARGQRSQRLGLISRCTLLPAIAMIVGRVIFDVFSVNRIDHRISQEDSYAFLRVSRLRLRGERSLISCAVYLSLRRLFIKSPSKRLSSMQPEPAYPQAGIPAGSHCSSRCAHSLKAVTRSSPALIADFATR